MVSWFYQIKNVMTQTLSSMMVVTVTVVLKKTSNVHKNRHQNVSCTKTSSSLSSCTCKESSVKTKAFCTSWSNLNNLVSPLLIGLRSWVSTSLRLLSMFPNSVTSTSLKEGNFWSQCLTVKTWKRHTWNLQCSSTLTPSFLKNLSSHRLSNWQGSMRLSSLKTRSCFPLAGS